MSWWISFLWIICDIFISCLDSHSDGTHSLQSIHWWASDAMLHFSKSVPMKKQTHLHLEWPEIKFSAYLHFWVNYSFNLLSAPNKLLCYLNNCFYSIHKVWCLFHITNECNLSGHVSDFTLIWIPNTFSLTLCRTGGREFGRHQPERCSLLLLWPESSCSLLCDYKTHQKGQDQHIIYSCIGIIECAFSFFTLNQHWMHLFILLSIRTFAEYSKMDNNWTDYW